MIETERNAMVKCQRCHGWYPPEFMVVHDGMLIDEHCEQEMWAEQQRYFGGRNED